MNKKRILSFLLAIVMIVTNFTPVFANTFENTKKVTTKELEVKTVEDKRGNKKNLINLSSLPKTVSKRSAGQAGFRQAQPMRDVKINIELTKHGLGQEDFDWTEVFKENGTFKVQAYYIDSQFREVEIGQAQEVTSRDNEVSFVTKIPADARTINVKTSFINNLSIKAYENDNSGVGEFNGEYSLKLDLYQIVDPKVNVVWKNPYGTKVRGQETTAEFNKVKFNLPDSNSTINLRDEEIFDEEQEDIIDPQDLRDLDGKTLEVTNAVDGKVTINGTNYKVTTKLPTATEPGEIKFISQPTVITPDDGEDGGDKAPDGYVRVTFDPTSEGKIQGKAKGATKFYDVLKGTDWNEASFDGLGNPTHETKTFAGWFDGNTKLADKAGEVAETTFTAEFAEDVVPQKPGEDKPNVPDNFVLVEFKAGEHGTFADDVVTKYWVNPEAGKTLADVEKPTVVSKDNYKFTGWDKEDATEIKTALEVTAQYKAKVLTEDPKDTENYAHVSFETTKGTIDGQAEYWVLKNEKVTFDVPTVDLTGVEGYEFKAWNPVVAESYAEDTVHNATFNYTGKDIVPQPGEDKPEVPENFVLVEFKAGTNGTLEGTTKYWVNPEAGKTLADVEKPTVVSKDNYKFTGWDKEDATEIKTALEVTAQYKAKVLTEDPKDTENYAHVSFETTKGTIDGQAEYWVLKNEKVTFDVPTVDLTGVEGYEFKAWNPVVAESYAEDTVHNATFNYTGKDIVPQPGEDKPEVPENFVLVEFKAGDHGTIADTETTKYWVNPTKEVDLTEEAPEVTPTKKGVEHQGWDKALKAKFASETEITATYKATIQDVNGADITNKDQTVREGDPIKDIVITPKDEDATITVDEKDLPEGVEYDKDNNKITGTPEINDWEDNEKERKIEIPVVVENPDGSKVTEKVTITVTKTEDVVPQKPGEDKPDVPDNFVLVEFKAGDHGTIADTETTKYWVNPTKEVDLTEEAPEVTPTKKGVEHQGWDKALKAKFASETEITATYKATIQDVNGADITNKDQTVREGDPIKDIVITPKDEDATITVDEKDLPEGVEYDKDNNKITGTPEINDWEDNEKERKIEIPVVVENPDGSKTTEKVTITVTKKTEPTPETKDNEKYEPETKPIVKDEGEKPSEDEIKDSVTVPGYPEDKEDPKVTIDDPTQIPDGNTPGDYEVDVTVEYPDGSKDKAKVKVTIKDKTTPTPQEPEQGGGDIFDGLFKRHDYTPTYPVKTVVPGEDTPKIFTHEQYIFGYPDDTIRPDGDMTRAEAIAVVARLQKLDLSDKTSNIYKDTKAGMWYNAAINAAFREGYLLEKEGENIRPNDKITRAELALLISHIDKKNDSVAPFEDVKGHKFETAINQAYGNERIKGYPDGTFKPDNSITRAEVATMLNKLYDRYPDKDYIDANQNLVHNYKDMSYKGHWGYYELVEAYHNHKFARLANNMEEWKVIIK